MHTETSFQVIRENISTKWKPKEKYLSKNSLYYTEKNFNFVRVFFKILYTLFTFDFTIEKISLYNTEKKSGFVDVFSERFTNYFHKKEVRPTVWGEPLLLVSLDGWAPKGAKQRTTRYAGGR